MYAHARRPLGSCLIASSSASGNPFSSGNSIIARCAVGGGGPVDDDMSWEGKAPTLRMVSHTEVKRSETEMAVVSSLSG